MAFVAHIYRYGGSSVVYDSEILLLVGRIYRRRFGEQRRFSSRLTVW